MSDSADHQSHDPPTDPGAEDVLAEGAGAARAAYSGLDLERHSMLREVLGLLAHEMRTPLGAIIGYGELLGDGLLGPLPERAADAVRRMATAGGQLRHLIDGLSDLMVQDAEAALELDEVDTDSVVAGLVNSARALAGGRGVQLDIVVPGSLPRFRTDAARLAAALDLAIGAAIRASPGSRLRVEFTPHGGGVAVAVDGTALEPARDLPAEGSDARISTGAGLRLFMARRMLRMLQGGVRIEGASPSSVVAWADACSIDEHPPQP